MYKLMKTLFVLILLFSAGFAGESLFGISDHSLGMIHNNYSGAGMARSYEVGSADSMQINYMNYALWTNFTYTAYSVKGGYKASFGDDGKESDFFNTAANFENAFMIVPIIKKKLHVGAGVLPYTNIEQRLKTTDEDLLSQEMLIRGGLSKALFNISYKVLPGTGVGLGYEYNFGKINKEYRVQNEAEDILPVRFDYDYRYYGHGIVGSVFYQPFNNLTLGATYRPAVEMRVRIHPQTNSSTANKSQLHTITLPSKLTAGAEVKIGARNYAGLDLIYQDWDKGYKLTDGNSDPHQTQYFKIGAGVERKQSPKMFTRLAERMDYRTGIFYSTLNHKSLGNAVKEYGLSFGFSFPLQRFRSRIDFAGVIGKRGSLDKNQYEEVFINFGVSINAIETWFVNIED